MSDTDRQASLTTWFTNCIENIRKVLYTNIAKKCMSKTLTGENNAVLMYQKPCIKAASVNHLYLF